MKTLKLLAIIGALAVALAHVASAQTVIRIVGSNGDRTATQTAISNLLAPGWTFQGIDGNANASTLSVATGANHGAWNGTYASTPVVIKVNFAGALAGIAATASSPKVQQRFVLSNGTGTGPVPNPLNSTNAPGVDYELGTADFGFSTNFQSTSPFNGTYNGVNYIALTEEIVGVSPLGFYASPGFPTAHANITTQQAQVLYTTGSISLFQFTGDFADVNKRVWAIGRNTDAGQRFSAYAEVGLGVTAGVKVWRPNYSAGVGGTAQTTTSGITYGGVVGEHELWPAETISGIFSALGSGGYNAGAALAPQITTVLGVNAYKGRYLNEDLEEEFLYPAATAGYYIGYLTPGDALNRVLGVNGVVPAINRGVALSYNGVPLHNAVNGSGATVNNANVQNGKYTAWLYNRLLREGSLTNATKVAFANALRDRIKNFDAPTGGGLFDDSNFKVKRSSDGGLVIPK